MTPAADDKPEKVGIDVVKSGIAMIDAEHVCDALNCTLASVVPFHWGYSESAYLRQGGPNERFFSSSSSFEKAGRRAWRPWAPPKCCHASLCNAEPSATENTEELNQSGLAHAGRGDRYGDGVPDTSVQSCQTRFRANAAAVGGADSRVVRAGIRRVVALIPNQRRPCVAAAAAASVPGPQLQTTPIASCSIITERFLYPRFRRRRIPGKGAGRGWRPKCGPGRRLHSGGPSTTKQAIGRKGEIVKAYVLESRIKEGGKAVMGLCVYVQEPSFH
ncbi:hypothetical protein HPB47_009362 [Ixodes persulcatus]|uniref:Uncharacterized protein n=1 Tax=Ixodes persulcatus TaxID=34615 RepID=A0AC60P274_IXOPE|nr:hypothetical protein HPB47_009362 [Ixodes persulcatus]